MITNKDLREKNKKYYDKSWTNRKYVDPKRWPHWNIIQPFLKQRNLEIGPGIKPKIPVNENYFIDISLESLKVLKHNGAHVFHSNLKNRLPFKSDYFHLICAFEVLEHLPNDTKVLTEIHRILNKKGSSVITFPLHQHLFNGYDEFVGHVRRYDVENVESFFRKGGFKIKSYAGLKTPWPSKFLSKPLIVLNKLNHNLFNRISDFLDTLPNYAVQNKIVMKDWKKDSCLSLKSSTTGLFVLEKLL